VPSPIKRPPSTWASVGAPAGDALDGRRTADILHPESNELFRWPQLDRKNRPPVWRGGDVRTQSQQSSWHGLIIEVQGVPGQPAAALI